VLKNGKVLAIGGASESGNILSTELYDPSTGHWTIIGYLNQPRWYSTPCVLSDGPVLVIGGWVFEDDPLNSTELYDPSTGNWTVGENLNSPRRDHTSSVLLNGQVLVTVGYGPFIQAVVELYDPSIDLSTTVTDTKHREQ
jgi:hypothetical protein